MKIYKPILVILLLMLSVSVVAAADTNDTAQNALDTNNVDTNVLSDEDGTYTDLLDKINDNPNKIELNKSYTYNKNQDNITIISFTKMNSIIEGNNNYINGNNNASAFKFTDCNDITIQNLVFKNCNSPIQISNSKVTTINVTFINNFDDSSGGAVFAVQQSNYISQNDKFIDNNGKTGSAIYGGSFSKISVTNGTFSNKNQEVWSMVYGSNSVLNIYNCTFANTTSRYAPAIFNDGNTTISKSKFINLHANLTAGAIAIKGEYSNPVTVIEDCEFINATSTNNGGAIFIDYGYGTTDPSKRSTSIKNTNFTDCSSGFGGAVLQLEGILDIAKSQFTNTYVTEGDGGAVYTSYAKVTISDSIFNNTIGSLGGAIYVDEGTVIITKSSFNNITSSKIGGAITVYDSQYTISDSKFEDNEEWDLASYYQNKSSTITNSGTLKTLLDLTNDYSKIMVNGTQIVLNPKKIDGSAKDSYFNLNRLGLVTPVKNQGFMGSCWAFGIAGAFESAFLIATNITLDISENYIQDIGLKYSKYGIRGNEESGDYYVGSAHFLDWFGAINEDDDVYDELGKITGLKFPEKAYHIYDVIFIPSNNKEAIKEALTTYGALDLYVRGASNNEKYYDATHHSLYVYDKDAKANHYVTLVGWNDTYSRNNFATPAPGDGAWICKNSWGTGWGDEGYFYVSYYDASIQDYDVTGFIIKNTDNYDMLYQNSVGSYSMFNHDYDEYQTTFTTSNDAIISAVGTYFEKANTPYTISIYLDNVKVYSQSGKSQFAGFETVKLNEKIAVPDNSKFSVRIKSSSVPVLRFIDTRLIPASNDYLIIDGSLRDVTDSFLPIKVYTFNNNINLTTENIIRYYSNVENTTFKITNGTDGENVTINFNGANYTKTFENGTVEFNLGILKVGSYPVKVYYNNQSITNYAVIKTTIDTNGVTEATITTNTLLTIHAVLYNPNGTLLKNTKVTVLIDGVKFTGTTTEKGELAVSCNPNNNIRKVYIDITNPVNNEQLRITINVISRFAGNKNVNMYYYDGSTYKVRVRDSTGNYVGAGEIVAIKIGKKAFKVKTDKNGWATLKIPKSITPGKYTIKATYMKQTISNKLTVKQVLKTKKTVKVKKSAKKLTLKATLKKSKTPLKKKVVKFKVKGKTYKAKTNKKGIVKVTLKKSVIKKLKAGKKYRIKVSYLNDIVKSTLKVRR